MTLSLSTKQRTKGPLDKAKLIIEVIANNLYYSLTLNNYVLKLEHMSLPISITIDELMENDFIIGNLVAHDAIIQKTQRIST